MSVEKSEINDYELKQRLASLYTYLSKVLYIKTVPKVILRNNKENANKKELGLTGHYDPTTKTIVIYITGRHDNDILRTFAHECIHFFQDLNGTLKAKESSGGEHYAQNDPHLRKIEYEAFLLGNIIFRDFQDELRYGPPKIKPSLPRII